MICLWLERGAHDDGNDPVNGSELYAMMILRACMREVFLLLYVWVAAESVVNATDTA